LFYLVFAAAALCLPITGATQEKGTRPQTATAGIPVNAEVAPQMKPSEPELAPDTSPGRYIGLIVAGLVGTAWYLVLLLNKFNRYWYLGVSTNYWSALYALVAGISGVLLYEAPTVLSRAGTIPQIQSARPWINWVVEFIVLLIIPILGPRSRARTEGATQLVPLDVKFSPNPFLALFEEKISDSIDNQRQKEVLAIAEHYSLHTIQAASRKALLEEKGRGKFSPKDIQRQITEIKPHRGMAKQGQLTDEKCEAIYETLTYCKYRRLLHFLKTTGKEEDV